jgi:aspartate/glutamate/glutamine transport system permease protein
MNIGFLQSGPFSIPRWEALFANFDLLWRGALVTLIVASLGLALRWPWGSPSASRRRRTGAFRARSRAATSSSFQNTPLLIQVFMLYNAIPIIWPGAFIPVIIIGIMGVGMYHGAYIAEVVRAGIQSIGRGQLEAALSQGLTYVGAMRYIIIPQAMRIVLPPLTNQAVNLIKNTSVIAIIAGGDLMYAGDSFAGPLWLLRTHLRRCRPRYFADVLPACAPTPGASKTHEGRLMDALMNTVMEMLTDPVFWLGLWYGLLLTLQIAGAVHRTELRLRHDPWCDALLGLPPSSATLATPTSRSFATCPRSCSSSRATSCWDCRPRWPRRSA